MARTAVVRSVSLSPAEAALADEVAEAVAGGSFTELVRLLLLRHYGEPLKRRMERLREAGIDPDERPVPTWAGETDPEVELRDLYGPQAQEWRR